MNDLARTWLRRVALGLPILATPIGVVVIVGAAGCGPCPDEIERYALDEPQAARVIGADGVTDVDACRSLCSELDRAMPDGGTDAGFSRMHFGTANECGVVSEADMLMLQCSWPVSCPGGRRPAALRDPAPARIAEAGAWLAQMAWLEAASVPAFEELARDLARFDAPASLVRGAIRAAGDERRHAAQIGALARARGFEPPPVARGPFAARSLQEIAEENAAEGGVRETYGALLAAMQAAAAADPDVRRTMRGIARDEARHALLSDGIDRWARTRLDGAPLTGARRAAVLALRRSIASEDEPRAMQLALGLPPRALRDQLAAQLG